MTRSYGLLWLAALFLFFSAQGIGSALELAFALPPAGKPSAPFEIVAQADGPSGSNSTQALLVDDSSSEVTLDLDPKRAWTIVVRAPGFWAEPIRLAEGDGKGRRVVTLVPTGYLQLTVPPHDPALQGSLVLSFRKGPDGAGVARNDGEHSVTCSETAGKCLCEVPQGRWDVRLAFAERVPKYFWQMEVLAGRTQELGRQIFVQGASVSGFVVAADRRSGGIRIELNLAAAKLASPDQVGRTELSRYSAISDERGFFQIAGLPPGSFFLKAIRGDWTSTELGPFALGEKTETRIREPIEIGPPPILAVQLEPPLDPYGSPWKIELFEEIGSGSSRQIGGGSASTTGAWSTDQATPGRVTLWILDGLGNRWLNRDLEWAPTDPTLFLEITHLAVRGRVRIGTDPILGEVVFGTLFGRRTLRFPLDEKGEFEGFLPEGGEWKIELLESSQEGSRVFGPLDIQKRPGKSYAEVDLVLPDTRLAGNVFFRGKPAAGARLTVLRYPENRRREAFDETDDAGQFEIRGIEPGGLLVKAEKLDTESEWYPVELSESGKVEIDLELQARHHIKGRVSWSSGAIPGATVVVIHSAERAAKRVLTGFDGAFEVAIPVSAALATVVVVAGGFDIGIQEFRPSATTPPILFELGQTGGSLEIVGVGGTEELELGWGPGRLLLREVFAFLPERVDSSSGKMVLRGLPPGLYRLCLPGARPPCQEASLAAGSTAQIEWVTAKSE